MAHITRRDFIAVTTGTVATLLSDSWRRSAVAGETRGKYMRFGLVTYMWGHDWDLPTLIENCETTGTLGVELRTTHGHGVEPTLNRAERKEVSKRFADSPVTLVGLGSNERYDNPDSVVVNKAIEATKAFVRLSHDVGGTGVKVKPDRFHEGVSREKTIEQIGRSLNVLGEYAAGYGQQIRLEAHGGCARLPTIRSIVDIANHENVAVCWNSNPQDLEGNGLEYNYRLVANRFGATCHIHDLKRSNYPFQDLLRLMVRDDYDGWLLLEEGKIPDQCVVALAEQVRLFDEMIMHIQKTLGD